MSVATTLNKASVLSLLSEMGTKGDISEWSDDKIKKRLGRIPKLLETGELTDPESADGIQTLEAVQEAVEGGDYELTAEEDLQEGDSSPDDNVNGEEVKTPKKRGRKPKEKVEKEKKVEEVIERPEVAHKFTELEKPTLKKISEASAKEWQDMTPFPRDRDFQESRYLHHKREMEAGTFRGTEWASCYVEETKETYRMNGKHTSKAAYDLFKEGKKLDFTVTIRKYSAPTLADAAYLYATFDPKWSTRTKGDLLKGYSASSPDLIVLPPKLLSATTAGIAFSKLEDKYRKLSTEEQGTLLIQHAEFGKWVGVLLKDTKKAKHLVRMSVVASMLKTWEKDPEAGSEFWEKLRDDSDDPKDSPTRILYRWLLNNNIGRGSDITEREVYFYCLKAWNAWRENEKTVKLSHYGKDKKTPEVV